MPRLPVCVAFAFAALAVCIAAGAQQVYKWKDANGATHYSDVPPPTGSKYEKVKINSNVATPVDTEGAPAADANSNANDDNPGASQPRSTSMADTPDNRAKLCKQLDANIAALKSKQPITANSANGAPQNLSDAQRKQALSAAQAQENQYCGAM